MHFTYVTTYVSDRAVFNLNSALGITNGSALLLGVLGGMEVVTSETQAHPYHSLNFELLDSFTLFYLLLGA